jgi:hypothetical protein
MSQRVYEGNGDLKGVFGDFIDSWLNLHGEAKSRRTTLLLIETSELLGKKSMQNGKGTSIEARTTSLQMIAGVCTSN